MDSGNARLTATTALLVCVLLLSSLVVGIDGESIAYADATTDAAALKQFENGRAAFERGELALALAAFTASMQALPSPNTRLYIARCQRGLGKIGAAFASYRLAAHEAADRLNATGEKRYSATRDAAQMEGAEIEKTVPRLLITLPADAPPTTSIRLDDVEIPRTALASLDVDPGSHTLHVTAPRRAAFDQRIDLAQSEQKSIDVTLPRLPTATIQIALKTKPAGIAVEIDGKAIESLSASLPLELDVGEHRVVVRAPGYRDFEWKQRLADGDSRSIDVTLEPGQQGVGGAGEGRSHGTPKWLFFGVAAVSVVALGIGTYFALDATSRASREKEKDPLTRDPSQQDKVRSEATTANVLFITGAGIAGGAGALAFITDWHSGRTDERTKTADEERPIQFWVSLTSVGAKGSF